MNRMKDKVVLITGGNSGIGACTAELMAAEGAKVVIAARRAEALEAVKAKITAQGGVCEAICGDVSMPEKCEELVAQAVSLFGGLDVLVNNAGVLDNGLAPIEKVDDAVLDKLLSINTKGPVYMARAAMKQMLPKKSGAIVNVASVAGYNGGGGAAYVTSKAAVIGLTKHIAMRAASDGVRCNAICPGSVVTPMVTGMKPGELDPNMMGAMSRHSDLQLPVSMPLEIANVILFLASEEASAVTGQILVIDHGANL